MTIEVQDIHTDLYQNEKMKEIAGVVNGIALPEPVKTVTPVEWYGLATLDAMGSLLYGIDTLNSGQVVVVDTLTGVKSNYGTALPIVGIRNIKVLSSTSMIVEADGNTGIYKYYITKNSGSDWKLVLTMPFAETRMLTNRSICQAVVKGVPTLFFGEYNINPSRVNGSTNDAVRLLKSVDGGETWSEVTRWNTDGSNNNTRHIHAVKQGPNGRIYVVTGDINYQCAIYSWDGEVSWPVNVSFKDLVKTSGLTCIGGRQALRAIDLIFKDDKIYFIPDATTSQASTNHEAGLWVIDLELSPESLKCVSKVTTNQTGMAGWLADVLPSGELVWLGGNENLQQGQKYNPIIISNRDWTDFKAVGAWRSVNTSTYIVPYELHVLGDTVYVSCGDGSAKSEFSTSAFKLSVNDFKGDFETRYRPDTIHPVFWIDGTNGSDTNTGDSPRKPWKTLGHALLGSRLTYGARLEIIGNLEHVSGSIIPVVSANSRGGDPSEPVVISGKGAMSTILSLGAANTNTGFFQMWGAASQKIELQDLRLLNFKDTASLVTSNKASGGAGAHSFGFVRCIIGDYQNNTQKVTRFCASNAMPIYAFSSIFESSESISNAMFDTIAAGEGDYYFENCLVQSGNLHFTFRGTGNKFRSHKCKFVGAFQASLDIVSGASFTDLSTLYCGWWTDGVTSSTAVRDAAGLTWNGQFKGSDGNQARGVASAFDGYSILNKGNIPLISYETYVF
jgi:hypothetical protein